MAITLDGTNGITTPAIDADPGSIEAGSITASTGVIVPVGTTAERPGSPATGLVRFNTDTNQTEIYNGSSWKGMSPVKKIAAFTSSGTWTVPTGVTYAIAHMLGGGGGLADTTDNATDGGDSSVAFASGTVTCKGGSAAATSGATLCHSGQANSGAYATGRYQSNSASTPSQWLVAGAEVTPAASITVTVGAGGAQGTIGSGSANGGSGYVYIEYYE